MSDGLESNDASNNVTESHAISESAHSSSHDDTVAVVAGFKTQQENSVANLTDESPDPNDDSESSLTVAGPQSIRS